MKTYKHNRKLYLNQQKLLTLLTYEVELHDDKKQQKELKKSSFCFF